MKKILALLVLCLSLGIYVNAENVGNVAFIGADEIEGNLFSASVSLSGCSELYGGQGSIIYDPENVEMLDIVSYIPDGYRVNHYDNKIGKISYLFYRVDSEAPALSGDLELFNLYFQINKEPEGSRISLTATQALLFFDEKTATPMPDSVYSAPIKDYTPPITTAPPVTVPPETTPTLTDPPVTSAVTDPVPTSSPDTVPDTVVTTDAESETEEMTIVYTDISDTTSYDPDDEKKSFRIFEVITISLIAAAVAGTAVYFVMKKRMAVG